MSNRHKEIDSLINNIFRKVSLRDLFEQRLYELKITQTAAEKMLRLSHRSLDGVLDTTQKKLNIDVLGKIALFLNKSLEEITEINLREFQDKTANEEDTQSIKKFIKENFDLIVLKKAGFIDTINDFEKIHERIKSHLNLNSIFDYKKRNFATAFWSGVVTEKNLIRNTLTRDFWLASARNIILKIDNPYFYDRDKLIQYFPEIRWNSTNVEFGLVQVVKQLYRLGITVIFQSPLSALHLRGATFIVNEKPCVILTDYKGFYPTLWHCLIHELYHVLFDLEEIRKNQSVHISHVIEESLTIDENEAEADAFARRYLFSEEKLKHIAPYIRNDKIIKEIAWENNVEPSIIYSYYAYETQKHDRLAWVRARRYMPSVERATYRLVFPLEQDMDIDEILKTKKLEIYN